MKCRDCKFAELSKLSIGIGFCSNVDSELYMDRIFEDDEGYECFEEQIKLGVDLGGYMKIRYDLNFRPFNVVISESNVLHCDSNDSANWKTFRHKLTTGNWKIKKIGKKSITVEKQNK